MKKRVHLMLVTIALFGGFAPPMAKADSQITFTAEANNGDAKAELVVDVIEKNGNFSVIGIESLFVGGGEWECSGEIQKNGNTIICEVTKIPERNRMRKLIITFETGGAVMELRMRDSDRIEHRIQLTRRG